MHVHRGPLVAGLALAALLTACGDGGDDEVAVDTAESADPARGQELFQRTCAACHGPMADGTSSGPPLVHEVYEPGHHSDESFQIAVAQGTPQHHWDYGPMPPVGGLDRQDVADITAWIRDLQREAGIID
jgi:mono/diheme cytochrome c family protein